MWGEAHACYGMLLFSRYLCVCHQRLMPSMVCILKWSLSYAGGLHRKSEE